LFEKGKSNYKPPPLESRQGSPTKGRRSPLSLKNTGGTIKSTSTLSEVLNGKQQSVSRKGSLRNDFGLFDTRELGIVEYEEENDKKFKDEEDEGEEEESEPSWQKKSESDDSSDGFRKPVDFGIDKETSFKLDKLNLMLMVGKESKEANQNRNSIESVPTTSRDLLDSPTRNYVKAVLGGSATINKEKEDEMDILKKSTNSQNESMRQTLSSSGEDLKLNRIRKSDGPIDHERELRLLQESVERFDHIRFISFDGSVQSCESTNLT
jgi:hypothetical protein